MSYDPLKTWKEENGFEVNGKRTPYAGGSEYDPTVEAIKEYLKSIEKEQQEEDMQK